MFSLIVDPRSVQPAAERHVAVRATGRDDLVMSWLNELLYVHEAESLLLRDFSVDDTDMQTFIEATAHGEVYDPGRHQLEIGVKAATFNGLVVRAGPPACLRVYFDV